MMQKLRIRRSGDPKFSRGIRGQAEVRGGETARDSFMSARGFEMKKTGSLALKKKVRETNGDLGRGGRR